MYTAVFFVGFDIAAVVADDDCGRSDAGGGPESDRVATAVIGELSYPCTTVG